MNTILGLPADAAIIFGLVVLATLGAFWLHEIHQCAKVTKASKQQMAKFVKTHNKGARK